MINLLVVKTFAFSKLPDFRTSFAIESFHTSVLHLSLLHRRCGAAESSGIDANGVSESVSCRVNCFAAAIRDS